MRIVAGASRRVAGARAFERLAPLLVRAGSAFAPAGAVVEVSLVGARRMARLNREFKGRRGAAEILTFPYAAPARAAAAESPIGEICICWPALLRGAAASGVSPRAYLLRLFVHGAAHLRGHRHDTDAAAARMEALERRMLARLIARRDIERLFP